jgi:hypothetical protein
MERRMREMLDLSNAKRKNFGQIHDLTDGNHFLEAIDKEDKSVVVLVFIFEHGAKGCRTMYECLKIVAKDHPYAKVCSIQAGVAGLSKHFKASGVPAILVYKAGELTTSFVQINDTLGGDDFYATDVEDLLIKHGVLTDKELTPAIIRGPAKTTTNDSDSD